MADDTKKTADDTLCETDTAREEVAMTEPAKAPLPDPPGLAHSLSPVDLPATDEELQRPLAWTATVIASASLLLALFNAGAIRGWAYELKPNPTNQRIVTAAETWFDTTQAVGLTLPIQTMRGWWQDAKSQRFGEARDSVQTETGPGAEAPEPAR